MSDTEPQVTDVNTYTQDLLEGLKDAPKETDGNPVEQNAGEAPSEERQEPEEGKGESDALRVEEEGEGQEEVAEESAPATVDKLDQIERLLHKEKELVRKELELKSRYSEAPNWKQKADEFDALASDPIRYLEDKAPQLLEQWVEARYGRAPLGDKREEPQRKQQQDPTVLNLQKKIQELEARDTERHYQTLVNEYKSELHAEIGQQKADLGIVEKYCQAHGLDLARECFEFASERARTTKQVVPPSEVLKAIKAQVLKEIEVAKSLSAESPAKNDSQSEEKPTRKTKTLSSGLKGSATRSEEVTVTNLDSYTADLLRELRKGGKG